MKILCIEAAPPLLQIPELLNPDRFTPCSALCALRLAHFKGGAPAPPPPPPDTTAEERAVEKAEATAKEKEEIQRRARGRAGTILAGYLEEAPLTHKASLKRKLGE